MNILLSTNVFITEGYGPLKQLMSEYNTFNFGLELFPDFENGIFNREVEELKELVEDRPLSMHGPYFKVEHSAPKGTDTYDYAIDQINKTLELCEDLKINHLVFHHNNKKITDDNKQESIIESTENLHELNEICKESNVEILVENAGVYAKENVLFDEEEFISMCKKEGNNLLIDIGHVNANDWSLENIIVSLKNQITHYHLHNNENGKDDHNRIHDGSLDFEEFKELYKTHTSDATLVLEYNYDLGSNIEAIKEDLDFLYNNFK